MFKLVGSKNFVAKNAIFRLSRNANFVKNFAPNHEFCHPKIRLLTVVSLFYEVLPKQFRGFCLPLFLFVKKFALFERFCQESPISSFFAIRNHMLVMVNRLQMIFHPKCLFSFVEKRKFSKFHKISSKINIFVMTASFHHFVSFSSKTKSFGA